MKIVPYAPFEISPAAQGLHYGQAVFEGLKAYKHNGEVEGRGWVVSGAQVVSLPSSSKTVSCGCRINQHLLPHGVHDKLSSLTAPAHTKPEILCTGNVRQSKVVYRSTCLCNYQDFNYSTCHVHHVATNAG